MEMVNKGVAAVGTTAVVGIALLLAALIAGICLGDVFETYHNASSL